VRRRIWYGLCRPTQSHVFCRHPSIGRAQSPRRSRLRPGRISFRRARNESEERQSDPSRARACCRCSHRCQSCAAGRRPTRPHAALPVNKTTRHLLACAAVALLTRSSASRRYAAAPVIQATTIPGMVGIVLGDTSRRIGHDRPCRPFAALLAIGQKPGFLAAVKSAIIISWAVVFGIEADVSRPFRRNQHLLCRLCNTVSRTAGPSGFLCHADRSPRYAAGRALLYAKAGRWTHARSNVFQRNNFGRFTTAVFNRSNSFERRVDGGAALSTH